MPDHRRAIIQDDYDQIKALAGDWYLVRGVRLVRARVRARRRAAVAALAPAPAGWRHVSLEVRRLGLAAAVAALTPAVVVVRRRGVRRGRRWQTRDRRMLEPVAQCCQPPPVQRFKNRAVRQAV